MAALWAQICQWKSGNPESIVSNLVLFHTGCVLEHFEHVLMKKWKSEALFQSYFTLASVPKHFVMKNVEIWGIVSNLVLFHSGK